MEGVEKELDLAQNGDRQAMEKILLEYMPLINGLVKGANKNIDK